MTKPTILPLDCRYYNFYIKEESLEDLLREGLEKEEIANHAMKILLNVDICSIIPSVRIDQCKIVEESTTITKILVPSTKKCGRTKPKPSDPFTAKFDLVEWKNYK